MIEYTCPNCGVKLTAPFVAKERALQWMWDHLEHDHEDSSRPVLEGDRPAAPPEIPPSVKSAPKAPDVEVTRPHLVPSEISSPYTDDSESQE